MSTALLRYDAAMLPAHRAFDHVTAGLLAAGLLALAAGLGRHPPGLPLLVAGACLGLAGLLHLLRHLRQSWRPVRTRAFTVHLAYVALFVAPCALTAADPARSLLLAAAVVVAYFSFHAFREAFTAAESGLCSARGFLLVLAGAVAALIAARALATPPDPAAGSWLASLAGDQSAPGRDFDRLFDLLLVGAFPLLATRAGVTGSRAGRWFWGASALLAACGILVAFGRAAWLALLLELGLLLMFDRRRGWLAAVLAATLLAAALLPGGGDRIRSIVLAAHPTNSQRLEQWAAALELTLRSPLLGHGLGSFGELYRRFDGSFTGQGYIIPHSLPLHIAAECGLPALVLFLAWMAWLFTGWRIGSGAGGTAAELRLRALRLGGKVAAAGLLLFSCFDL